MFKVNDEIQRIADGKTYTITIAFGDGAFLAKSEDGQLLTVSRIGVKNYKLVEDVTGNMIDDACEAEEKVGMMDLEEHSRKYREQLEKEKEMKDVEEVLFTMTWFKSEDVDEKISKVAASASTIFNLIHLLAMTVGGKEYIRDSYEVSVVDKNGKDFLTTFLEQFKYRFSELSDEVRVRLMATYVQYEIDDEWNEGIFADYKSILEADEWYNIDIRYSLGGGQGDGASITANNDAFGVCISRRTYPHYVHSNMLEADNDDECEVYDDWGLGNIVRNAKAEVASQALENMKELSNELYNKLQEEWLLVTSEETYSQRCDEDCAFFDKNGVLIEENGEKV